jgi:hypothetical protein
MNDIGLSDCKTLFSTSSMAITQVPAAIHHRKELSPAIFLFDLGDLLVEHMHRLRSLSILLSACIPLMHRQVQKIPG